MLVEVTGIKCKLRYVAWDFPGTMLHPWLQAEVLERLRGVDHEIRSKTDGRGQLLVWDALRSMETQRHLFSRERARFAQLYPEKSPAEIDAITAQFVRIPSADKAPPHTTGGAVDVTIWIDDTDQSLGEFDDFSEFGRADYFEHHEPQNEAEEHTRSYRQILRDAMLRAGFVGIQEEWWHFEYGTRWWAEEIGEEAKFNEVLTPPEASAISLGFPRLPARQGIVARGVAQVFPSALDRNRSLRGEIPGHYYARTRHPNGAQVSEILTNLVGSRDCLLLPSGLTAALLAIWAHTPPGGSVLIDRSAYYETRTHLKRLAFDFNWTIHEADLSGDLTGLAHQVDVIFCDHPTNWTLQCPNLKALSALARSTNARLVVDTSVQPLQRLTELGLADVIVLSLSKYPSAGETIGGAVMGPPSGVEPTRILCTRLGMALSPEAAGTLLTHLRTLPDRVAAISKKAEAIADMLRSVHIVDDVRLPDLRKVNAFAGGQLSFRIPAEFAARAEQIIAAHSLDETFPLAFGCTFGALYTTFEHFSSRNAKEAVTSPGSELIEPGRIRLGIGHEAEHAIMEAVRFTLYASVRP
ncbi:PLP-dependent transferase [Bradyrhizobium sp. SZCCHNRI1009]|uniref:PLP-dependent transferase n=1 Tax=Bradyrhizobium sp. SZCCHNRI1009 TaxID=3057277 RepID=UPI002916C858|nr:PLP-dependent transferase [Bradyrhizobium sp. SZCCHNRI1009]